MKQESFYIVIPYPVLVDPNLSDVDKLVYGEISALTNKEGYCYASNKYIGDVLGKKVRAIQYAIEALKKTGYIRVELVNNSGQNTERKIYLSHATPMQNFAPPHANNDTPPMLKNAHKSISKDSNIDYLAKPKTNKKEQNVDNIVDNQPVEGQTTFNKNGDIVLVDDPSLGNSGLLETPPTSKSNNTSKLQRIDEESGLPIDGELPNGTKYMNIPAGSIKDGTVSIAAVLNSRQLPIPDQFNENKINSAHQAYGMEVMEALHLPKKYTARIMRACKGVPYHIIQRAIKGALGITPADPNTSILNIDEQRANYVFTVLNNGDNTERIRKRTMP